MSVEVDEEGGAFGRRGEVSGAVVHVLISLAHEHDGEGGVARALALAGEGRSFTTLGDVGVWSSLEETVALFNAVSLVTGDPTIGLHVGERLLEVQDGTGFVDRLTALTGPRTRSSTSSRSCVATTRRVKRPPSRWHLIMRSCGSVPFRRSVAMPISAR